MASLLKHRGDRLGQRLLKMANSGSLQVKERNLSILIHGFSVKAPTEREEILRETVQEIRSAYDEFAPPVFKELSRGSAFPFGGQ